MAKEQVTSPGNLEIVVLAAGQGTRMRSAIPKVLHPIAGRPMLVAVLETLQQLSPKKIHVVVGHQGEEVRAAVESHEQLQNSLLNWVVQEEQLGTGHAVAQALPGLGDDSLVLVTYGDVPLVSKETLLRCASLASTSALAIVTANFDEPGQLGRIARDGSEVITEIVEYADATPAQRQIREINSGIMALPASELKTMIAEVEPHNAQGEYYLTDLVALARSRQLAVDGVVSPEPDEVMGVNDRWELAKAERLAQLRLVRRLMDQGVSFADPHRVEIRGPVEAGQDCFVDINVVFEGTVRLGDMVSIGAGCVLKNAELGDGVRIEPHTVIDGLIAEANCILGPFARIRPGTELGEGVKIGNFVEAKKSKLGKGTKASHLTYLGDAELGEACNVGAGTVTCNYDGVDKHKTTIGDGVFVGTNSTLVAPIELGDNAYVAAGSTVTTKVGDEDLAVGRARQRNISGWKHPAKRKAKSAPEEG